MKKFFKNIKKYYKYAIRSAKAELKSEVSGSYLNWLWWVIEPLCFMIIYTFVFTVVFQAKEQYFPAFVFIGLTCWEFFNRMITGSVKLIANNRDLVTKVYIPKYILLLSKSFTYLFKFFISLGLAFILMLLFRVPLSWNILYLLILIPLLYIISFSFGLLLMHFGVFIEDLKNLTNIGLKFIFYLSGVFYNINIRLHGGLRYFLLRCNPIAFIMSESRKVMLYSKHPSFEGILIWYLIGIVLFIVGVRIIHKNENTYAKVI